MADNLLSSFLPDDRASFGIFPQMKPRRRFQDPVGAANVPLDVTRGRVAGLAGLLPDVLNFMGRSPMPTEQFGETQYEPAQQLPYGSEYFLENLPLKPTSRIGEVAGQAGAFVPLNPMPAARAVAAGVKALGPTAVRMGEGYLQRQGLMPGVVPEAPVPPATPLASMIEKPQAPVSELGFYSAAEQAALNLPRKSGTGESFLNDLMKGQDVKKDELSWMGLDDYLKGKPNVTRQEVQDFISNNRVDVREVKLGGNEAPSQDLLNWMSARSILPPRNPEGWQELSQRLESFAQRDQAQGRLPQTSQRLFTLSEEAGRISEGLNAGGSSAGATKYQNYQLPGGENYREILLTLPNKPMEPSAAAKLYYENYKQRGGEPNWSELPVEARQSIIDSMPAAVRNASGVPEYSSSHFDQPNILAHMRVNDRVDADGKKMLLIEEIQSDWHQAGKLEGYQNKSGLSQEQISEKQKEIFNRFDAGEITREQRNAEINSLDAAKEKLQGVPDAPFKDTWHQLALKRALKYAADNGYDRVGLTTGRQQAERYDLSKQITSIEYKRFESGKYNVYYTSDKNSGRRALLGDAKESELEAAVGKDLAKKIIEGPQTNTFSGLDLQVGGEGMKKYYDEIYPAFLAKQGKKYNAKTGETQIPAGRSNVGGMPSMYPDKETIRYIDISPEMRGGVKKGQPLFTAAPIGGIGLGAGTQDQQQNSINSFIQ